MHIIAYKLMRPFHLSVTENSSLKKSFNYVVIIIYKSLNLLKLLLSIYIYLFTINYLSYLKFTYNIFINTF